MITRGVMARTSVIGRLQGWPLVGGRVPSPTVTVTPKMPDLWFSHPVGAIATPSVMPGLTAATATDDGSSGTPGVSGGCCG